MDLTDFYGQQQDRGFGIPFNTPSSTAQNQKFVLQGQNLPLHLDNEGFILAQPRIILLGSLKGDSGLCVAGLHSDTLGELHFTT